MAVTASNFVRVQNDSVFSLLVIPVILAGYVFGSKIGFFSGVFNTLYIAVFVVGILGRTDTAAYVVMGAILLTAAGYGIGLIMELHRHLNIQKHDLMHTQNELEKQLREKHLLLSEVHHRIKNNIYTLISLLDYQSRNTSSSEAVSSLRIAAGRMRTMAILYDKVYRVERVEAFSVKEYLSTLAGEIVESLTPDQRVRVSVDVENFDLDVRRLAVVGTIVNEAITNAMKYAFNDRNPGQLTVSAHRNDNRIRLIVGDDGPGIPESVLNSAQGFGMMMIHGYAEQLGGTVRFDCDGGTRCILEFPIGP